MVTPRGHFFLTYAGGVNPAHETENSVKLRGSLTPSPLSQHSIATMFFLFQDPEAATEAGGETEAGGNALNDALSNPDEALNAVKDFAIEKGPAVIGALVTLVIGHNAHWLL